MERELVLILFTFAICSWIPNADSHGRLMEPPMRASIWRFPEFEHLNPPVNYDDDSFWCGNLQTQYNQNGGKCGICGDNYADPVPRSHEDGGKYGRGIVVRNYTAGQVIPLTVELTGAHDGFFEFRLCTGAESEECYSKNILKLSNGSTRFPATKRKGLYHTNAKLPDGVTCSKCSIQWTYTAGNNWGPCGNGSWGMGCGNQETFRGCSDIRIY